MLILPLLLALSMVSMPAEAREEDRIVTRCAALRMDQSVPELVGYALKRTKLRAIDLTDETVVVQPLMLGMKAPRVSLPGRDVRLAVTTRQSSPQELWHKAQWNAERPGPCTPSRHGWWTQFKHGLYGKTALEVDMGVTPDAPRLLFRSRAVMEGMITRPRGLQLGAALAVPIATNTEHLLQYQHPHAPVRHDIARFSNGGGVERLYASWRLTPLTDLHLAFSAGWLEEMYGGAGGEMVWRPFGSAFWAGADAWRVWRRDPDSPLNAAWTDESRFTGHVRVGYDVPQTRTTLMLAAGQYLGGDRGATLGLAHHFGMGLRVDAALAWTDRAEAEGFFKDSKLAPSVRFTLPLGNRPYETRMTWQQVGRDSGQMLDRPLPLEKLTEAFSVREYARLWPAMFQ